MGTKLKVVDEVEAQLTAPHPPAFDIAPTRMFTGDSQIGVGEGIPVQTDGVCRNLHTPTL